MRVLCNSIADFLTNLESFPAENVIEKTVWINRTEDSPEAVKHINLHASAVIITSEDIEYILEGGEWCGKDYTDGEQEKEGSKRAEKLIDQIRVMCVEKGLIIKPGMLDM